MTVALSYLTWMIILAILQVFFTAVIKRQQDGMEWGAGNRDRAPPEYTGLAGRMVRAQANLFETLPCFIGAVLIAHVAGREDGLTAWGARLFFWARLAYIPAYALGLVPWRTFIWIIAMAGLVMAIISIA